MFTRLANRAPTGHTQFLKNRLSHERIVVTVRPAVSMTSLRYQSSSSSSSSSSRDNDNSNADLEPMTTNEVPVNAALELHRVDLAHGSFFALHRPLLGIANGPMFASNNNNNNNMMDEDFEGKFSSYPFQH
ncbi:hypothetical protein BGX28_003391 [Mortierella sp. GBA30]|nr:hypothetical protein BGX28_003391 [Mortierella sp. GBA30]